MRTKLRSKVTLLVMALAMLAAGIPAIAFADDFRNDLDDDFDADFETVALEAGHDPAQTQTVNVVLQAQGSDGVGSSTGDGGCNLGDTSDTKTSIEVQAISSDSSVASVKWASTGTDKVNFTGCNAANSKNLTVTAGSSGTADVTLAITDATATATSGVFTVSGTGSGTYDVRTAQFTVNVTPPPNTPPDVSVTGVEHGAFYEINDVPTPGCSVTDAEDTDESATAQVSTISGPLAAYGLGTQTVTCSYTDDGDLNETATATYTIRDTGNPTITDLGATAGTLGLNGWYTSQVTNTFQAQDFNGTTPTPDNGAGFAVDLATTTPPLLQYNIPVQSGALQEGNVANPVVLSSGSVSDVAGNSAASVNSVNFKIDLNNPSLGTPYGTSIVDNNAASSNFCTGSAPSKPTGFLPSDTALGSGIDTDTTKTFETWTTPSLVNNPQGFGNYSYIAKATDNAGRTTTYPTTGVAKTYSYTYGIGQTGGASYSGVLQPINQDGSSRFKLGSTIPVKFTLTCGGIPITDAVPKLTVKQGDSKPDPGVDEAISTSAATTGNAFRLVDATTGTYMFNLSTKSGYLNPGATTPTSFAQGSWTLGINFGDTTSSTVLIQLVR
jgi:hypothetical protein